MRLAARQSWPEVAVESQLIRHRAGYFLGPHSDLYTKLVVLLIYLAPDESAVEIPLDVLLSAEDLPVVAAPLVVGVGPAEEQGVDVRVRRRIVPLRVREHERALHADDLETVSHADGSLVGIDRIGCGPGRR